MKFKFVLQLTLVYIFSLLPERANACAVCFTATEETLEAFYATTIILTLLPLVMVSSIVYWLYRKHRKIG